MNLNYSCSNVGNNPKSTNARDIMIFWDIKMLMNYFRSRNKSVSKDTCPNCGSQLIHESGCAHCPNCGWSACDN